MSNDGSDFDDNVSAFDDQEEADHGREHGNIQIGEDDDNYSMEDEDNDECTNEPDESHNVTIPKGEEVVKSEVTPAFTNAYIQRNGVSHSVPYIDEKGDETLPGRRRDYGVPLVVDNDEVLGAMNLPRNWPPANEIQPTIIVVVKARHNEDDVLLPDKKKGPFGWYARVITKKDVGKKTNNHDILKPIPKKVCKDIMVHLAQSRHFMRSSLITWFQPDSDNAKPFPVAPNNWQKCPGLKSTGITPAKKELKEKKMKEAAESSKEMRKSPNYANHDSNPELSDDEENQCEMQSPTALPSAGPKKPTSQSILQYTKPKTAQLDKAERKQEKKTEPAKLPKTAPVSTEDAAAPVSASETHSKPAAKRSRDQAATEELGVVQGPIENTFKRVRYYDVDDKTNTSLIWKGNRLYVIEP
jgi:hypothetical protein